MESYLNNEKSNNYLEISPINIENENIQSPIMFQDNSNEIDLSLTKKNTLSQVNGFNSANIKEKEILEKELEKEIEELKKKG